MMKYSKLVGCVAFAVAAASISSPAWAGVTLGKTILFLEPVSPQFEPLTGQESEGGADVGEVLYTPHDGSFETGYSIVTQEGVEFVQFWEFPSTEGTLTAFEACFYSVITVANFEYEFVYYSTAAFGEEAEPGSLREDRESLIFDIPGNTVTCNIIVFEAQGDPGVEIRDLLTYLGAKWNGQDFPSVKILVDTNGPDTTNGWGRKTELFSDWLPLRVTEPFTAYRNLGIRFVWLGPIFIPEDIFEDGFESGDTFFWDETVP